MSGTAPLTRRTLLQRSAMFGGLLVTGNAGAVLAAATPRPLPIIVHKDPNCGCCTAWAERMSATGRFAPRLMNERDIVAVKTRLRVPPELGSCHTSEVGGFVIEGHVPPADVSRLLRERPKGIVGLAVPGMPAGAPGMETESGTREPFEVIAFTASAGTHLFNRYA